MALLRAIDLLQIVLIAVAASGQKDGQVTVVYVDEAAGSDDLCFPPVRATPCASLEAIASGVTSMGNITSLEIVIRSSCLELSEPVKFKDLNIIRITGAPTQIQCISRHQATSTNGSVNAGIAFTAVENLFLRDIAFEYCGTVYEYPPIWENTYYMSFKAAIHVFDTTNVHVRNIAVSHTNGAGMAVSRDHLGLINIMDSSFDHNTIPVGDEDLYAGGGGVFIHINSRDSRVLISNCTFVNNTASTTDVFTYSNYPGKVLYGRGLGGGLFVRIIGNSTSNTIDVTNCSFIRNSAFFGGGFGAGMYDRAKNNTILVTSSYFTQNGCHGSETSRSWGGGGLHLGYNNYAGGYVQDNQIQIKDSIIVGNCGDKGGGVTVYSSPSDYVTSNKISFVRCSWNENWGRYGSAVYILPHTEQRLSGGFLPRPEFTDCKFVGNSASTISLAMERGAQQTSGIGAIYSSQISVKFISSVLFEHNTDSAIVVINAVADFSSCDAVFANNTGDQGGAVLLVGVSSIKVGPGHVYHFLDNIATDRGGAISSYLVDEHAFAASRSCFIQYSEEGVQPTEWKSNLTFVGNHAPIGRSIFSTSVIPCWLNTVLLSPKLDPSLNISHTFHWPNVMYFDDPPQNQIATDGAYFETVQQGRLEIMPGENYLLQVNITDDLGQKMDASFKATIYKQEGTNVKIDPAFLYVEDRHIKLLGEVGETGTLELQIANARKSNILLDFALTPCPVGYSLNDKQCECDVQSYEGLTKCNTSSMTAYIQEGFWAGYLYSNSSLVTAICPIEFCPYNDTGGTVILLPRTSVNSELDAFICAPSRRGVLCGECKEGYSAYYHSPHFSCQENRMCNIGWLFYILSELVPVTFLFVLVLFLNVRFTSGRLNGIVFFSQILNTLFVDAIDVVKKPNAVGVFSWGYNVIYGFLTLDFFTIEPLSFCLWKGATVLDVLAFKYVTITYSLLLVIFVIVFMKYFVSRLFGNCIKMSAVENSVIHGLSTFLVICYMQCIKVSLTILLSRSLQGNDGSLVLPARVWFSGNIEVFSVEHLPYAIPALLCLMTLGVFPPILLLVYPLNHKVANFFKFSDRNCPSFVTKTNLSKFMPVLDSFQGDFKNNFRFFAGLYFVYRWVGLLAYATSPNLTSFYAALQGVLTLMLVIHAVAQPYKNRWYNVLDSLLLTDLALINLCTGFNYYYTRIWSEELREQHVIDVVSSFQLLLIYLPILSMCVYPAVVAVKKCCKPLKKAVDDSDEIIELEHERQPCEEAEIGGNAVREGEHLLTSDKHLTYGV